jgi:ABC-type Fe3+/spermidine/putrescine transport system ATPase subunit
MRDGRIVQVGAPDEVYERPATPWVATFLGYGRLVPMVERDGRAETPLGTVRTARAMSGSTRLLVRPEHLRLMAPGEGACDAVIEARRFEGSAVMLVLRADGIDGLWATCPPDQRSLRVGDRVGLVLTDDPPPVAFAGA